mgnify:CR=1 FL=1
MAKHPNSLANLKKFKPGESGNPRGKKPGNVSLIVEIKKQLEADPTELPELAKSVILNAKMGNAQAIKQIFDRIDGPVPVVIDDVSKLSDAELIERAKALFGGNSPAWTEDEEE